MRGALRLRPPKAKLFPSWDVAIVLKYLKIWDEPSKLPLNKLLLKTAFLVALVCCKRPADLCNMQVAEGYWQLNLEGFMCQPLGFGKTEVHNPVPPIIEIEPFFEDPKICPVLHLAKLSERLEPKSNTETKFWLSAKRPKNAITSQTMCMWLNLGFWMLSWFREGFKIEEGQYSSSSRIGHVPYP